jgi:hypothetical protein
MGNMMMMCKVSLTRNRLIARFFSKIGQPERQEASSCLGPLSTTKTGRLLPSSTFKLPHVGSDQPARS